MDNISLAIDAVQYNLPKVKIRLNEPMKNRTSFKIGGSVRAMFFPEKIEELESLCSMLRDSGVKPLVMGRGTNLLVCDNVLDLVVINTMSVNHCERTSETEITAGAGAILSKIAVVAGECGLTGMEFAHGIPGTLGGAVSMNAGAYGGEMKDVVHSSMIVRPGKGASSITNEEHGFSYRKSRFSESDEVILSSVIRLEKGVTEAIRAKMDELNNRRLESQPLDLPSAGSVFKRPAIGFAGSLIEQAGLKGYIVGGAQVSEKHSGFIVNRGDATFSDVMNVIEHVQETILQQFGVELEPEIKIIT